MSRLTVLPGLRAAGYARHTLHADDRLWVEKNCYVDAVIELVHALGLEPLAAMGFCAAVDFEGDNFTFFKPGHEELRALFGVDIQELNVWRPLVEHAEEHLGAGKFIATDADSFWLPDTVATDCRGVNRNACLRARVSRPAAHCRSARRSARQRCAG